MQNAPYYVDVHAHLTHEDYQDDFPQVLARAEAAGLGAIVVNGLDPASNQEILRLAKIHPLIKPALGIYPAQAVNALLPADFPYPVPRFDVDAEILKITTWAASEEAFAIGECGLDGYSLPPETFSEQERVFKALAWVAKKNDIPLIVHSRSLELRVIEVLAELGVEKVDFHCFSGKTKLAITYAQKFPRWCFSIPANALRAENFQKLLSALPLTSILTETDSPYLSPVKAKPGERSPRNEPMHVVPTVELFAKLRGLSVEEAKERVYQNYVNLFTRKNKLR